MLVHLGRVWSDGDPFVVVDRGHAEAWMPSPDDYERLVVGALARHEVEIEAGNFRGVLLGHEAGEGALEVFRLGDGDLLALIVRYADELDLQTMVRQAAAVEPHRIARIEVRSDRVVLLRAAVPWAQAAVTVEAASPSVPRDWGPVDSEALVVDLPAGTYALDEIRLDHERHGFDAWRIRRA